MRKLMLVVISAVMAMLSVNVMASTPTVQVAGVVSCSPSHATHCAVPSMIKAGMMMACAPGGHGPTCCQDDPRCWDAPGACKCRSMKDEPSTGVAMVLPMDRKEYIHYGVRSLPVS